MMGSVIRGFVGWITAWAAVTFASAALFAQQHSDWPAGWADRLLAVWDVANAVPPAGKLSFGITFAVALIISGLSGDKGAVRMASGVGAVAGSFALAAFIYPVSYYPSDLTHLEAALHVALAAAIGGTAFIASSLPRQGG